MKLHTYATVALLSLLSGPLFSQPAAPAPAAAPIADVHASPYTRFPFAFPAIVTGDRYILRGYTMVDLVAAAYGVDATNVQGGPIWLERDRFDIIAKAPATMSKDDTKLMLQALLADRFKLAIQTGSKPMPAYVLSVKGTAKMKPAADDSTPGNCKYTGKPPAPGEISYITFSCLNTDMDSFAQQVHQWAGGYLTNPVVNSTGLKGGFDFDIKWTDRGQLTKAGADGISIFDAVDKELGLKLELQTAPRPVMIVASVNEQPSPNPAGLDKALPPLPPREFEVATVKPSRPDMTQPGGSGISGDRIDVQYITLRNIISFAWDLNPNDKDVPVNAPKWLDEDHFDILGRVTSTPGAKAALPDPDELRRMIRDLVTDRFQMKSHIEAVPMTGYTLSAANPKLKKADPTQRTNCKDGPGPDGKDPRIANPILNRLVTCQNISMTEFAQDLQRIAGGYIYGDVLDTTGIEGRYDFTVSFSGIGNLNRPTDASASGEASAPTGAISLFDALKNQLGLKLEKQKRPVQVLVIDHIEEKPTEN